MVDIDASFAEDGRTLFIWYMLAGGRQALQTYTLGAPIGQALTAPFIVEGVWNHSKRTAQNAPRSAAVGEVRRSWHRAAP